MKKTRVKEQIAGPRVITKRGSKTATRRSASASSERAEQGFVKVHLLRGGQLGPAYPSGGTRNFNFLQLAAGPPKRPACRDSIQISPRSKLPPSGPTTPCALSRLAPAHLLRWRTTSQKVQRETRKSDRPNCAPLLSGSSELAAYKRIHPHPSKNLRRRQEQLLPPGG